MVFFTVFFFSYINNLRCYICHSVNSALEVHFSGETVLRVVSASVNLENSSINQQKVIFAIFQYL